MDLLKMQYLLLFKIKANYFFIGLIYIAAGLGSYSLLADGKTIAWLIIVLIGGSFFFFVFFNIIIFIQLITASAEKGWIGETIFKIEDQGFYEKTAGTETRTNWNAIAKIYKSSNYTFVRINAYRMHIIPKRAFGDVSDFARFSDLLIEKVNNA